MSQLAELGEAQQKDLKKKVYTDGEYITLVPREEYKYKISLDRVDSTEKILAWILHLSEKNWMTTAMMARLVKIACKENGVKIQWS